MHVAPATPDAALADRNRVDAILTQLESLAALGITHTQTGIKDGSSPVDFELFGEHIIPAAAKLGRPRI